MISVQKVIFPGIFLGCLFLVLVTSMIASPKIALAENISPTAAAPATAAAGARAAPVGAGPDVVAVDSVSVAPADAAVVDALAASNAKEKPAAEKQSAAKEQSAEKEQASAPAGNNCRISPAYPDSIQQWCDLISRFAGERNLEPNLIAALILQESGGNAQAYSRNGAVGLMQVMPRDGLAASFMCINGPCFGSRPSTQELYDPEFNISYGTRMLAGLIEKKGNVRDALFAYGPSNMGYRYADIILSIMQRYQ